MSYRIETDTVWNGADAMRQFDTALQKSVVESSIVVESSAKLRAPVKSGFMRGEIARIIEKFIAVIVARADYSIHVEKGTKRQAAQPFLLPGLINNVGKILQIFRRNNIKVKYVD